MKKSLLKTTLAVAVLSAASTAVYAGGVFPNTLGTGTLNMMTTTITQNNANSDTKSYTSNPALAGAGWGHVGSWYTFHTHMDANYRVTATAVGEITPGISLWKTDGIFDGGENQGTGEKSSKTIGTPHSFNQIGNAGDRGLWWATDDSISTNWGGFDWGYDHDNSELTADKIVGNTANGLTQLIGYANDGSTQAQNGWSASVVSDGNADGVATIDFTSMMHGDYVIFIGGANANDSGNILGQFDADGAPLGASINLSVSQVPVPAAAYLFGTGLIGLFASARRKMTAA